ncbi:MAG: LytR C-terminal domain-containing protein [Acidimicrobiales bacterium]
MARAGLVLAAFVLATILLLGVIHPSAAKSAAGSAPGPAVSPATGSTTSTAASHASRTPTHSTSPTTTVAPSTVSVLVANASNVTGAAAAVSNELRPGGWNLESPVNASAKVTTSTVYYLAGQQQSALAVATALHLPSSAVGPYTTAAPISSIGTAEVLVVVGPDLASRASTSTTSSTASTATTSARSSSTSPAHH